MKEDIFGVGEVNVKSESESFLANGVKVKYFGCSDYTFLFVGSIKYG